MFATTPAAEAVDNTAVSEYPSGMEASGSPDRWWPRVRSRRLSARRRIVGLMRRFASVQLFGSTLLEGRREPVATADEHKVAGTDSRVKPTRGVVQYRQPAGPPTQTEFINEFTRLERGAFDKTTLELIAQQQQRNALHAPGEPRPLRLGPQAVEAPGIWLADPRAMLPKDRQPKKLNSFSDPEWMVALESMVEHREARRQKS